MKKYFTIFVMAAFLNLTGCVITQVVDAGYLASDQTKALRVGMIDGSTIRFPAGKYRIEGRADSLVVIGKGVRSRNGNHEEAFTGSVASSDIRTVEIVEPSVFIYTIPIYIGIVTAIGLVMLLSFGGRGVGG